MRPGRQDLNVNFFTFRSCRPLDGRQTPYRPLEFPIRIFLKYKNEKSVLRSLLPAHGPSRGHVMRSGLWLSHLPRAFYHTGAPSQWPISVGTRAARRPLSPLSSPVVSQRPPWLEASASTIPSSHSGNLCADALADPAICG